MSTYKIGELIRALRVEKDMTQEDLCEGVCTPVTLSRIENGKNEPSRIVFEALIERLGENSADYISGVISEKEFEIYKIRKEITVFMYRNDLQKMSEYIHKAKKIKEFSSGLNLQFLILAEVVLNIYHINNGTYGKEEIDNSEVLLLKAIHLTKNKFSIHNIKNYILTDNEITLMNMYAIITDYKGFTEKAVDILYSLQMNIEKSYTLAGERTKTYLLILYNLSKCLGKIERYMECIDVCDIGIKESRDSRNFNWCPHLVFNKLYCLNCIGDEITSKTLLPQAYYGLLLVGDYKSAKTVKQYASETFGICLE